jgi:hypothetical protein
VDLGVVLTLDGVYALVELALLLGILTLLLVVEGREAETDDLVTEPLLLEPPLLWAMHNEPISVNAIKKTIFFIIMYFNLVIFYT